MCVWGGAGGHTSLAGMLRSSTNTTALRPMGGPYTPFLRLSKRPSTWGGGAGGNQVPLLWGINQPPNRPTTHQPPQLPKPPPRPTPPPHTPAPASC